MKFTPRPYQVEAIKAGVDFLQSDVRYNAFEILPTGSGKSLVIANTVMALDEPTLILQPQKEILVQNYHKFLSYGGKAGIYSASFGSRHVDKVTYATIGSIVKKKHLFRNVKNIIVDECHLINSEDGMYKELISSIPAAKVLGLTATPYRLSFGFEGSMLTFLNRSIPRTFDKVIYSIQNNVLFDAGHLAKLEYYSFDVVDRTMLSMNSAGTDFSDASLRAYYRQIKMPQITILKAKEILAHKKNLLVFCSLVSEAHEVSAGLPGSVVLTAETSDVMRDKILMQYKSGIIKCVINVGILTTGFDYLELEGILISRSTMSLALYYQMIGRAMRPHPNKQSAWIVDLGGNIRFFGKIETMQIKIDQNGKYSIWNNNKQLTDIPFSKN